MSFDKHKNFVQEMTVTFSSGKVGEDGSFDNQIIDTSEPAPMPTTGYVAVDQFSDATNDMIKNFINPVDGGSVGEMNHEISVPDLEHNTSEEEMNVEDNQIGFEYADGKLHISIDGNDIYLSNDAIASLKDYLANIDVVDSPEDSENDDSTEDDSEETEEPEEEDDSEESDDSEKEED